MVNDMIVGSEVDKRGIIKRTDQGRRSGIRVVSYSGNFNDMIENSVSMLNDALLREGSAVITRGGIQ